MPVPTIVERTTDNGDGTYTKDAGTVSFSPAALAAILPAKTATNRSISVTTSVQNAMPANTARRGWKIKNDTAVDIWFNFLGAAAATPGSGNAKVAAGGYMASEPGFVETGAMSVIVSTGTAAVTIVEFS